MKRQEDKNILIKAGIQNNFEKINGKDGSA